MEVKANQIPKHIAIIMDGNGRWAKQRNQPRFMGHRAGLRAVENVVRSCVKNRIEVLSLFAFSSENWRRPQVEINLLMELFSFALKRKIKRLSENNIRLKIIGDIEKFPTKLQQLIRKAEAKTANNTGLTINIAANYGGRWDLVQAVQTMVDRVAEGNHESGKITEQDITQALQTATLPEPDLFIRTGGEQRLSNFMLWQMAYSELYFTDALWPDFDEYHLEHAMQSFSQRERRFGKTSEQIRESINA